ncbi:MAG: hypothetical protein AAFQ79_00715 [Pseudomonadota bacterium]
MTPVTRLVPHDTPFVDPSCIENLVRQIGKGAAERFVGRALEDLALVLNRVERAKSDGDWERMIDHADSLGSIAEELGLVTLATVASALAHPLRRGDAAAAFAIVARLVRVGEKSLVSVWSTHDMSL